MSTGTGVNVTKAIAYAVLTPSVGVNVSKSIAYAVLGSMNANQPSWSTFFPGGVLGIAYSQTFDMPSAAQTVVYSVVAGSLPNGLSLTALTGNQAKISGTPTVLGTFSFTLRATNTYGTADQAFSISIVTAGTVAYTWIG